MSSVEFTDNSIQVKDAINQAAIAYLHEAAGELTSQVANNSRVDTGDLRKSWSYVVDESKLEATIGSPLENAIWEEFGTGLYAVNGDGRKTPWAYYDAKGVRHWTRGKKPNRAFLSAFNSLKSALIRKAEKIMEGIG